MEPKPTDKGEYNPEEEVAEGDWQVLDLPDVKLESGEENLTELFSARTKLYRWRDDQWKERGVGNFRIMEDKESKKRSCILRQETTMKIMAYFFLVGEGLCVLREMKTAEKSLFWSCVDLSEGKSQLEKFCLRFKTVEEVEQFKKEFNDSFAANKELDWGTKKKEEDKKDDKTEEKKAEDKPEEAKEETKQE